LLCNSASFRARDLAEPRCSGRKVVVMWCVSGSEESGPWERGCGQIVGERRCRW